MNKELQFFNLMTGEISETDKVSWASCYWGDNNLFFDIPMGQISINFNSKNDLIDFCDLLLCGYNHPEYTELHINRFLIALEEDEGCRNLCIRDSRLYFIINLKTDMLRKLSQWLRLYVRRIEE